MEDREILKINIMMKCDYKCEDCEKFFECKDAMKEKMFRRRRMVGAIKKMSGIKYKVAVSAGKGGVGKSLLSVNLATTLAMMGRRVTILDQDLDGSTVPKMFGIQGEKGLKYGSKGLIPATDNLGLGIDVISLGLIYPDEVITLFHQMRRGITEEFVANVDYGERDWLIIDLPPGTSSDSCNLLQYIPDLDGTVVITVSPKVAQLAARKATLLAAKAGSRVLGIVENMSGYVCECGAIHNFLLQGGGESLAKELNVPFLGRIPMDGSLSQAGDLGVPYVYKYPDSLISKKIREVAENIEKMVQEGKE
ncbi:MAG: P-loop NTPase [Syntrophales bacterium]